ncbi:MAG: ammonium transporter [Alphaproteobacteria bacterium]
MVDSGDTAWILTSTALVLFMTLPGLALFYGGLVQSKNILSVLMQCFAIACLASILWVAAGYSLAFSEGNALIGGLSKVFLAGVAKDAVVPDTGIPETLFVMFQMTFAIITPALIIGAYVERIKFSAVLMFSGLWLLFVYAPVTHWVWGGGWLAALGVMDFAGGIVVHVTAGVSALIVVWQLGPRPGFPDQVRPPHAPWMVMVGAAMLWVGWFGFNAGSALSAGSDAAMAMLVTHLSASAASLVWMLIEWIKFGKPSLVGFVTGTIAGLATITPASGYVGPIGGICLGITGGFLCYFAVDFVKRRCKLDDALDVLAVHGVGGATGTLLAAVFAATAFGGVGFADGVTMGSQFGVQILGVVATIAWAAIASLLIIKVTQAICGLRVSEDETIEGLDYTSHGEKGYHF